MNSQPYQWQPQPQKPPRKTGTWKVWLAIAVGVLALIGAWRWIQSPTGDNDAASPPVPHVTASRVEAPHVTAPTSAATTIPPLGPRPSDEAHQIRYEVISDVPQLNYVTWFDEVSALQQSPDVTAPWSLDVTNSSTYVAAGTSAQTTGTSVTCRVIVDGVVRDEETSTGQYAVVLCNGGPVR